MNRSFPIDFVVTWVDGSDPVWLKKKAQYIPTSNQENDFTSEIRYRELGLFKYWFRAIEKYAPWVNHIFLVTDKQIPNFLDISNEKLTIIDHSEIIDKKYLPTFNSSTIELNIHKIPNLSEHFVYFNDDFYLNSMVKPNDFFSSDGFPKDTISQSIILPTELYDHCILNNVMLLNENFDKKKVLKKNFKKFFNFKQGLYPLALNICFSIFPKFSRLYDPHTSYSLKKSEMEKAMSLANDITLESFRNRQRGINDISIQWIRYFMIASGSAEPRNFKIDAVQSCEIDKVRSILNNKKISMFVLQDDKRMTEGQSDDLNMLFEIKYREKSSFEK